MAQSPWMSIWFNPKEALDQLKSYRPTYMWWLFAFILSLNTHVRIPNMSTFGTGGLIALIIASIVLTTCVTWGIFYIGAFILWKIGGRFGGGGTFDDAKRVYVWSRAPFLILSLLIAGASFTEGFHQGLANGQASASGGGQLLPIWITVAFIGAIVWTLFLYVKGLMHVNHFGATKAWATLIITAILSLILILFTLFIISLFIGFVLGLTYS